MISSCVSASVGMSIIKLKNEPSNGLNLISLFAGCGGSSLGYKAAGYDIRLAVEWDKVAARIYRDNFPETPIFQGDIADLPIADAKELAGLQDGGLDVLDGSPPCQGFSTAGMRHYTDDRNQLFKEYVRILRGLKPKAFIMENVAGLRKGKMKLMFAEMTKALKDSGYRVSCRELNAWWYGVPQTRTRLIWIGIREDLPFMPSHPRPVLKRPVSVKTAFGYEALVDVNNYAKEDGSEWRKSARTMRAGSPPRVATPAAIQIQQNFDNEDEDLSNWDDLENGNPAQTLVSTRAPLLARSWVHPNPENVFKQGWSFDRPAGTLAAIRPPSIGYGTGESNGMMVRYINIEEAKILQSFPADFKIDRYKYIGNSVPPLMARAVGKHLAEILNDA